MHVSLSIQMGYMGLFMGLMGLNWVSTQYINFVRVFFVRQAQLISSKELENDQMTLWT